MDRDWEGKTGIWAYGPWVSNGMGHCSNVMGQKKRNMGIFVSDVTFVCVYQLYVHVVLT